MVVYRQKRAEYQSLRHQIDALQKESDHYTEQINALQTDPKTIEKRSSRAVALRPPGRSRVCGASASTNPDTLDQRGPEVISILRLGQFGTPQHPPKAVILSHGPASAG